MDRQLSKHFKLSEFTNSQEAARFHIDNTPNEGTIRNLIHLCDSILEPARESLGRLSISSGFRCLQLNMKTPGSSTTSAHVLGYAADVIPLDVTKMEFARWVIKHCKYDQVILEYGEKLNPAWVHVSADPKSRMQVLEKLGKDYEAVKI